MPKAYLVVYPLGTLCISCSTLVRNSFVIFVALDCSVVENIDNNKTRLASV